MTLLDILREYPLGWSLEDMSYNKALTWDVVHEYKDGIEEGNCWSAIGLSSHPCISDQIVTQYSLSWDAKLLSRNTSISLGFIEQQREKSWSSSNLSLREDVDWSEILSRGTIVGHQVNIDKLSSNTNIPAEFVARNRLIGGKQWNFDLLSSNEGGLDWSTVLSYRNGLHGKKWDVDNLSANNTLLWSYVQELRRGVCGKIWNSFYLSSNPCVPLDYLSASPTGPDGKEWDVDEVSMNEGLTTQFINAHINNFHGKPMNVEYLSMNPSLSIDVVIEHPELNWDYGKLAATLPWEQIESNIRFFEDYADELSSNSDIKWSFVENHIDDENWLWDMNELSTNIS